MVLRRGDRQRTDSFRVLGDRCAKGRGPDNLQGRQSRVKRAQRKAARRIGCSAPRLLGRREMRPEFWMPTRPQDRYQPLSVGRSRFSNFGFAFDLGLSLGFGRRATPEPAHHADCRHADYTAPQQSRLTRPGMIRFDQFAIGVRRRRRDDRSRACPSLRSGNPTADIAERL